jgi:histidinol-phosphatase (PHP family)
MISLHNHSTYCDGKNSPAEMLQDAIKQSLTHFGLSGHAPVPFETEWSIKNIDVAREYITEIEKGIIEYPDLKIYKGLEADYIPGKSYSFDYFREELKLNYIIGSVHLVRNNSGIWFIDGPIEGYDRGLKKHYDKNFMAAMSQYYQQQMEMLEKENFEILAHCDKVLMHNNKRYVNESDDAHLQLLKDTLKMASEKDVWVEINTRGLYKGLHQDFYPGTYIFSFIKKEKIKIIKSADGHATDQIIKGFSELDKAISEFGIEDLVVCPEEIEERFS